MTSIMTRMGARVAIGIAALAFIHIAHPEFVRAQSARVTAANAPVDMSGRQLFVAACANCHGDDGRGATRTQVGFPEALPDFSDCSYASRENAQDWAAIVHEGGPVRAFTHRMPSFGAALTAEQIARVVAYVRSICRDNTWPRGELNLPRPIYTEKAFPEDELVMTVSSSSSQGTRTNAAQFIYEKRFGARNQMEYDIPFAMTRTKNTGKSVNSGVKLGDISVAYKRALLHDGNRGYILSMGAEVVLPTGDTASGAGDGATVLEPFVLAAHLLPGNSYIQFHGGYEGTVGSKKQSSAAYARTALGTTVGSAYGRSFSPMLEVIADRDFYKGAITQWDWIPQMEVSLSRRQHILASFGMRVPITDRKNRPREWVAYLNWDWYDGGLFSAWR